MTTLQRLNDMSGRRVLITGGTGHLGRMMADTLAELGARIVALDLPGSDFASLENHLSLTWGVECCSIPCDLEVEEDRDNAISRIKDDGLGLSCLINNAAFVGTTGLEGWTSPFEQQTLSTWRRALEVNLTAPFHLAQAFTRELSLAKGGNIINITSIYGELAPDWKMYSGTSMGNPAAYSASKGGLQQLTRWLASTLSPGIRVNGICPGGLIRDQPAEFVQRYNSKTPLNRMAVVDDFRGAVSFLASDLSQYVTGQILKIEGGYGIW